MDNTERAAVAEAAVEAFMKACRTDREDAVGDLICDLMHLAEADGDDPLVIVRNAISHHYSETHHERAAAVEIKVEPQLYPRAAPKYSELKELLGKVRTLASDAVVEVNSKPSVAVDRLVDIFDLIASPTLPKSETPSTPKT